MLPKLPRVVSDGPLSQASAELLHGKVELLPWETLFGQVDETVVGIYTFGHPRVDASMLDRVPKLKVISNYGVGVDHVDLEEAKRRAIPVGNTPRVLDGATADLGFCLLLAVARGLLAADRFARGDEYVVGGRKLPFAREVHGKVIGIIGLGRIGREVAKRARAFDMEVLYHNRNPRPEVEQELTVTYTALDELLMRSDFVVLCVPLTDQTRGMIAESQFELMKPTAILVNIARGGVVDTEALTEALLTCSIFGAGLDVTDPEPLPRDHPLLSLENVVLTPHIGSATQDTRQRMSELSVENLLLGLEGKPLLHRIV
ncbi:MAG: D-glycerate dehydrogenase [Planctomycetales bacterium]|nr:D-glycerate dehydrogenase [Planctomycetales bacterium]